MKNICINNVHQYYLAILLVVIVGCNEPIVDFGFDSKLFGQVLDQVGTGPLQGDITSGNFVVHAQGERDNVSMVMRVKDDGSFSNTALFPQKYKIWAEGPFIESPTEKINIDLSGGREITHDFQVTPFLNVGSPQMVGNLLSTEISVNYNISGNAGLVPQAREIYCSTVRFPTATTGSGPGWHSFRVVLPENQGITNISGLSPGTRYFVRIGARAVGKSAWNYSEQIIINTP